MGCCISKIRKHFIKKVDIRVLLLGLDNAGKTTTLYRLKVQSGVTTVPTVGFNVESYLLDDRYKLNIWVLFTFDVRMWADRTRSGRYGATTTPGPRRWHLW